MALGCGFLAFAPHLIAQDNRNQHNLLLLPSSRESMGLLQQSCRLWTHQTLRAAVADVSQRYNLAIWIDRRIDPTQTVQLLEPNQDSTLGAELNRLSHSCNASGGLIENVYVIAPQDRLARIQRSAIALHGQLSSFDKEKSHVSRPLEWTDISTSNELLDAIRATWSVTVEGQLAHDLFHDGRLPNCSLATQITLLLGGFDLQAVVDRSSNAEVTETARNTGAAKHVILKLGPLSEEVAWQDNYACSIPDTKIQTIADRFPGSQTRRVHEKRLFVHGETNLHIDILSFRAKPPAVRPNQNHLREPLYSFSMDASIPVEMVFKQLAQNFQFEIVWSDQCTPAVRNRLIQLRVKDATRSELLKQIGEAAHLTIETKDNRIELSPTTN